MNAPICRWGILGAANIARKNWQAIRHSPNCSLTAVASRRGEKARRFIEECQSQVPFDTVPRACGSYEEVLSAEDVDAVYIPLPTVVRKQWAIRTAEAGKHVLAEKPVGPSPADVVDILEACQRNNVQFMDGVMFMHSRRLDAIREVLTGGDASAEPPGIGRVTRISSQFTFGASQEFFKTNIRTNSQLEPLGCLGDLGWYNIRFALWVMDWQLPDTVCGHLLAEHGRQDSPASVPTEFSAELFFPGGVSASFHCSFLTGIQQWANISGTEGCLHVPDFVLPFYGSEVGFDVSNAVFNILGCDFNMEQRARRLAVHEYSNRAANAQESHMFRKFADLVLGGETDTYWGDIALKTQQVLDACLRSARSGGKVVRFQSTR